MLALRKIEVRRALSHLFPETLLDLLGYDDYVFEGKEEMILHGHSFHTTAISLLSNGDLITGSFDKTIRIWDLMTGKQRSVIQVGSGSVTCVIGLPNERFAYGSMRNHISVWNLRKRKLETILNDTSWTQCLAILPNNDIVSGLNNGLIRIWNLKKRKVKMSLKGHTERIMCLTTLSSGRVVSGSYDGTVRVWDSRTGEQENIFRHDKYIVQCLGSLSDKRIVSSSDRYIKVWNLSSGTQEISIESGASHFGILPNGRMINTTSCKTIISRNLTKEGECQEDIHLRKYVGYSFYPFVLPDGRVAFGTDGPTIRIWS